MPVNAPTNRVYDYIIIVVASLFVLLAAYPPFLGDTLNSRLATVYSLTEHRTFTIAQTPGEGTNPFEPGTVDKVQAGDRIISSKPPVLPLLMTAEYLVLRAVTGWDLGQPEHIPRIAYVLTLTFVGAAYVLTLLIFLRSLEMYGVDPLSRTLALAALAFATQWWGFAITFNNHVPAAAMAVLAIYLALGIREGRLQPSAWRFALFGLAAGLVLTVDLPASIFPFMAACYLLYRFPAKTLTWGMLGAALPLLVHALVLWRVTGSPLPVQMHKDVYFYQGSYWRYPIGIDALNEPKLTYLFHMTFGRKGVFSLYPILLLGVVGALMTLARRPFAQRGPVLLGGVGTVVMIAYYVMSTNNYGGATYGFRWLIPAMPVLIWMGVPVLERTRVRWAWLLIGVLWGVSFYSAWQSTVAPWSVNFEWTCRFLGPSF
jgi:hypothetical protein